MDNDLDLFSYWNYPRYFTFVMFVELHIKEYEKVCFHTLKKMKHDDNHKIKDTHTLITRFT